MIKSAKPKSRSKRKLADSYLRLIMECPLVSIKTDDQLQTAQAIVDRLITQGLLDRGEELYLDALSDLIAAYEDVHFPIAPASDADMLRHLLDAKGITQAELHRQTGLPKSTISEVLSGKKTFSKSMIRVLAEFFQVDASVLIANL